MPGRSRCLPDGWCRQAFKYRLEPDQSTETLIRRHCGMRRFAHNWAIQQMRDQHNMWSRRVSASMEPPELRPVQHRRGGLMWFTLPGLRKHWNRNKNRLCVDEQTGEAWWRELSKEAAAN